MVSVITLKEKLKNLVKEKESITNESIDKIDFESYSLVISELDNNVRKEILNKNENLTEDSTIISFDGIITSKDCNYLILAVTDEGDDTGKNFKVLYFEIKEYA